MIGRVHLGFLIDIAIQYVMNWYILMIGASIITLESEICMYVIGIAECINASLNCIFQYTTTDIDPSLIEEQLVEFIQLHSRVKQLSKLNDLFKEWEQFGTNAITELLSSRHIFFNTEYHCLSD